MSGRRITILGGGPSSAERRLDILRYCEGTEIWTLNNMYRGFDHIARQCSRWFELHSWQYLKTWDAGVPDHFVHLASLGVPVYTSEHLPAIMDQHQIDWVRVFTDLCGMDSGTETDPLTAKNYFLGSPSLMLALALWEHDRGDTIEYIQSYGIDTSDPQHKQQRQSWAFWCGQTMARGIKTGGTMCDFMAEPEMDGGLAGLREKIGDSMESKMQAAGHKDFAIAAHYTDDEPYIGYAARLEKQCRDLGIQCYLRKLRSCEYNDGVALNRKEVFNTVRAALDATNKPVIYMDVDDELLKAPTLPIGFDSIGIWKNPEMQDGNAHPEASSFFAIAPTEKALKLLQMVEAIAEDISPHRAINGLWAACKGWKQSGVSDLTNNMRGCFKINPSRHRQKICYT